MKIFHCHLPWVENMLSRTQRNWMAVFIFHTKSWLLLNAHSYPSHSSHNWLTPPRSSLSRISSHSIEFGLFSLLLFLFNWFLFVHLLLKKLLFLSAQFSLSSLLHFNLSLFFEKLKVSMWCFCLKDDNYNFLSKQALRRGLGSCSAYKACKSMKELVKRCKGA